MGREALCDVALWCRNATSTNGADAPHNFQGHHRVRKCAVQHASTGSGARLKHCRRRHIVRLHIIRDQHEQAKGDVDSDARDLLPLDATLDPHHGGDEVLVAHLDLALAVGLLQQLLHLDVRLGQHRRIAHVVEHPIRTHPAHS
eukprot:7389416-Prymnesium_polylepis.2